MAVINFCRF